MAVPSRLPHDMDFRVPDLRMVPLDDPQNRFGAGHENVTAVPHEVE
jgi:hypothetical protein